MHRSHHAAASRAKERRAALKRHHHWQDKRCAPIVAALSPDLLRLTRRTLVQDIRVRFGCSAALAKRAIKLKGGAK